MAFKNNSAQAFASETIPALFGTANDSPLTTNVASSDIISVTPSDASELDWFGAFCRTGYGKVLVSAHRKGTANPTTANNDFAGAVYAYDTEGNNEIKMVEPGTPAIDRYFGYGLGITDRGYVIGTGLANTAYLFDYSGNTSNVTTLTSNTVAATRYFGRFVAANGGKIAIGGLVSNTDKIHVYDSDGSNEQVLEISSDLFPAWANAAEYSDGTVTGVYFGSSGENSIAIGSDRIVVGAKNFPSDYAAASKSSGAVFVYDTDLNYITTLRPSDREAGPAANAIFSGNNRVDYGISVAVGCGRIAVSGMWKARTSEITGVGCVYLYDMNGKEIRIIDPEEAGYSTSANSGVNHFMRFGETIRINGGRIYVVARDWDGPQGELEGGGGVFQFTLDGDFIDAWRPSNASTTDQHGALSALDVRDGIMVVGSYAADPNYNASAGIARIVKVPDTITPQDLKDMNKSLI